MKKFFARLDPTAVLLAVLAFGVYLPGFWWGAPHATAPDRVQSWGVDDGAPLQPLADVANIIQPKPDRNFGYPLMHSFLVTAAYAPYLGWLWLSGQFHPSAVFPFGLPDPVANLRHLTLIAHFFSVLMATGVAVAAFDAARVLWNPRAGVLAALFVLSGYPLAYYSRTGNPDATMLFFMALAFAALARCIAAGFNLRRAVWLGIFAGFAMATKEQSFAIFVSVPPVLLALHHRNGPGAWRSREFWKPAMAGLVAAFLAFGLGSGLFVDFRFYLAHFEFGRQRVQTLASAQIAHVHSYPFTWDGNVALARLLAGYLADGMTLPGLLLSLVGVAWACRRAPRTAAPALSALVYVLILFFTARSGQLRYLMPPAIVLAFFAACAVAYAWESRAPLVRFGLATVALLSISLGLLRGADLTHAMINDSRYSAAAWLESRVHSGARVEYFGESGELPPLPWGVVTTTSAPYSGAVYRPALDSQFIHQILKGWHDRRPDMIILLPDHSSPPGMAHNITCPPQVYQGLLDGTFGYELAAYFQTPPLLPWVRRPALDYPSVNPPIRIFTRSVSAPASPAEAAR